MFLLGTNKSNSILNFVQKKLRKRTVEKEEDEKGKERKREGEGEKTGEGAEGRKWTRYRRKGELKTGNIFKDALVLTSPFSVKS